MSIKSTKVFHISFIFILVSFLQACGGFSSSNGSNEDSTAPTIVLTSPDGGELLEGMFNISWTTNEENRSTVEIHLSSDSGVTYPTLLAKVADNGSYSWNSSDVPDGIKYRIQVTATDVVGNTGLPAQSNADFLINNIPHVQGNARFYDTNLNAILDNGDLLIVPFDHNLSGVASPTDFYLPVFGDNVGSGSAMTLGPASNEVTVVVGALAQIRSRSIFDYDDVLASSKNVPSGVDLLSNASLLLSTTSGFSAEPSSFIDIIPGFALSDVNIECNEKMEVGDLNLDGITDIVCTNGSSYKFIINDGVGFRKSLNVVTRTLTSNTNDIELGDMDGDGDLDLVAASEGVSAIWRNNGDGTSWTATGQNLISSHVRAVKFADLNGNGDLDLVIGAFNDVSRTYINNGSGVFSQVGSTTFGNSPVEDVVIGNIDGDTDTDVILIKDGQSHDVYSNNGSGDFTLTQSIPTSSGKAGKLLDVDGDNDLDLIIVNNNQSHSIWKNNGTGNFTAWQSLASSSGKTVTVGDTDYDKDIDIIIGNSAAADQVYLNNGLGSFTASSENIAGVEGAINTSSSVLADFEQDGALDYAFATPTASTPINLFRNSISATWGSATIVDNVENYPVDDSGMEIADFNGDGYVDLLVDSLNAGAGNRVLINDGTGTFLDSKPAIGSNANLKTYAVADLNNDGDIDFVNSRSGTVWHNNGDATFVGVALGFTGQAAEIFDVDRDGDLDIVLTGSTLRVFDNNGTGVFTNTSNTASRNTRDSANGDFDGDGDVDIVISGANDTVYIYVNNGSGVFTEFADSLTGVNDARSIAVGDINKNGLLDIMAATWSGKIVWWKNIKSFSDPINFEFTTPADVDISGIPTTYGSIALNDINGDGYVDVVAGGGTADPDATDIRGAVLINDGTGNFVRTQFYGDLLSDERQTITVDIDNDGDKDAVSINRSFVRVYRNK